MSQLNVSDDTYHVKFWLHLDLTNGGKLLLRLQGNVKPLAVRFMDHLKSWIHLMRKQNA